MEANAVPTATQYELRYPDRRDPGRGYAFACDASGHVDIDQLDQRDRIDYLYARVVAGHLLARPFVRLAS